MIEEKDLAGDGESSRTKPSKPIFSNFDNENRENGIDFLTVRSNNHVDGVSSKSGRLGNELSLSYLCENRKISENLVQKGKEIATSNDEKWIERDFLNFKEIGSNSSLKRIVQEEEDEESHKKSKIEALNLSLALPVFSQASNGVKRPKPTASERTTTTFSNDFTAATFSNSYSHPFSHNPSCSLTLNSTDFDCSDQIWFAGEGTNGSVHSRFRPNGEGSGLNPLFVGKTPTSDHSFLPSDLPAKRDADEEVLNLGGKEESERFIYDVVAKPISSVAKMIQGMAEETLESAKEYLRNLIDSSSSSSSEKLMNLQKQLDKRCNDLTKETLSKCVKDQLDILVTVRTGLKYFLSGKIRIPMNELVEIFLFLRCKNVNCKSLLPVDDCECKICSSNKGFCSSCMCPVCLKFDSANNTCSWVGCDVCSHWCHAACGIQKNLIKPGLSLKGLGDKTEMMFLCVGCGHKSEMFGFVKDVFLFCAKTWGHETLVKELVCVAKIFQGSDDAKGKELYRKAHEMVNKLESKRISPTDACNLIIHFFNWLGVWFGAPFGFQVFRFMLRGSIHVILFLGSVRILLELLIRNKCSLTYFLFFLLSQNIADAESVTEFQVSNMASKELTVAETSYIKEEASLMPLTSSASAKEQHKKKSSVATDVNSFDSLESMVRIKEAESRMFQKKADEARREAESFKREIEMKTEKMEEEYTEKQSKLCLQEIEERRRKKLEELKGLENSHCDYKKMKVRMEAEIGGLLKRMEVTKQQYV